MTIYTRLGAPVRITEAELRDRWYVCWPGRANVYDTKPTAKQINRGKVETFKIWWLKAVQTGVYPDGSSADKIGQPYLDGRWLDENEFRADDGIREIHRECEMKRDDRQEQLKAASAVNKELSKAIFG